MFAFDANWSSLANSDLWSIHVGIVGDIEQVASDIVSVFRRGGFDCRMISPADSMLLVFFGAGQRGEIEFFERLSPLAIIAGQPDQPVSVPPWFDQPERSRTVLARSSGPDRLEMSVMHAEPLDATVASWSGQLTTAGFRVAVRATDLPRRDGGGRASVVEMRVDGPRGEGSVQLFELVDGSVFGRVSVSLETRPYERWPLLLDQGYES